MDKVRPIHNSNSSQFSNFLDLLSKRTDVIDFVLLGDFIDMWRRDVSGLFLEFGNVAAGLAVSKKNIESITKKEIMNAKKEYDE